mmetsp:Transcript_79291/g.144716  ORF Transcript_79291/g.144716 Transcript_79291/m.144716 type:complete len:262 (+) Transcript_79291:60-845(+)
MAIVDLGCMKLPFEGPFNLLLAFGGIAWGMLMVTLVFSFSSKKGPAVLAATGQDLSDACSNAIIVTCAWCILYYNYLGIGAICVFVVNVFEMVSKTDVTEKFQPNAGRFSGNMFEQSPVFLSGLWMYTLFADYQTGWTLGVLYMVSRALYPFYYMANNKFTFWFENCTQIGYGVNGVFILGSLWTASGGDWLKFASGSPISAAVLGFIVGSFAILPSIPTLIPYTYIHYKYDNAFARQNEGFREIATGSDVDEDEEEGGCC